MLAARGFRLLPLQTPWVREQLGLSGAELLAEMKLLLPDGKVFGGADAVVEISRSYMRAFPLRALAKLPGGVRVMRAVYRWIARNRYCSGTCGIEQRPHHHRHAAFFEMP